MKLNKFLCAVNLIVIAFLIILAGCTAATDTSTTLISRETVSSVDTIPATRVPAEQTSPPVMVTQTPIPVPSSTPTATITPMPIATTKMEATITETISPTPTLTDTELSQLALDLLENNNGCQLPCWWGITPGQTTWDTAYELIRIFDRIPYRAGSEIILYEPVIPLPIEVFGDSKVGQLYNVQNDVVIRISVPVAIGDIPEGYLTQYTLPAFLTTYGPPAEVWLSTYRAAFENDDLPFFAVLFYPEQGIVASYSDNGVRQGDFVQGCPQENPVSYLVLMPPGINQTFKQAVGASSAFNREYLSLEEATGMDVATFYETFKNPDNTTCLETSANLWR
jgi:hypothetical protein